MTFKKLLLVSILLLKEYAFLSEGCKTDNCLSQAIKHSNDYVKCDMCACDDLCGLSADATYYNCFVEVNIYSDIFFLSFSLTNLPLFGSLIPHPHAKSK
jgi:hypothetical protein